MEILLLLAGIAFLLWFFVSRPRKAEMRYNVHRDALAEARSALAGLKQAARERRIRWPYGRFVSRTIEALDSHVNDTSTVELGGRSLEELLEDVYFARQVLADNVTSEQIERMSTLAYNDLFRELRRGVKAICMDADDYSQVVEDAEAAVRWARNARPETLKIPLTEAMPLIDDVRRLRDEELENEREEHESA